MSLAILQRGRKVIQNLAFRLQDILPAISAKSLAASFPSAYISRLCWGMMQGNDSTAGPNMLD